MSRLSIRGLLGVSWFSGYLFVILSLCASGLQAQSLTVDPGLAKELGNAAANSNSAAYILGVICVASLGLAGWSVQKRDDTIKQIAELSASINAQTKVYLESSSRNDASINAIRDLAVAVKDANAKPCAMSSPDVMDLIRGKLAR